MELCLQAALDDGELWVAGLDNEVDGAALWFPPGKDSSFPFVSTLVVAARRWIPPLTLPCRSRGDFASSLGLEISEWLLHHVCHHLRLRSISSRPVVSAQVRTAV